MPQMKYEKHNARQLFVEKGIERVSFSAVADSCGIARATLYKYFPDKESLLWAIHRQALRTFGNALLARAEARPLTALERFSVYFEELARRFELDPDFLLFFDLFEKTYQAETARRGSAVYERMFRPGDFGSGDTARFLCENFNDGSLRAGLDAQLTAVSATYTAVYVLIGLGKDRAPLSLKYGMEAPAMARFLFDAFLQASAQTEPRLAERPETEKACRIRFGMARFLCSQKNRSKGWTKRRKEIDTVRCRAIL